MHPTFPSPILSSAVSCGRHGIPPSLHALAIPQRRRCRMNPTDGSSPIFGPLAYYAHNGMAVSTMRREYYSTRSRNYDCHRCHIMQTSFAQRKHSPRIFPKSISQHCYSTESNTNNNQKLESNAKPSASENASPSVHMQYKTAPPPPSNPATTNEVQLSQDDWEDSVEAIRSGNLGELYYIIRKWRLQDIKRIPEFAGQFSKFYISGSRILWHRFNEARKLKKDIRYHRTLRQASRRELLFIRSAYIDMLKLVPLCILFCPPGGMVIIVAVFLLVPSVLPSVFQTARYQIQKDIVCTKKRHFQSNILLDNFRNNVTHSRLPVKEMDELLDCLDNLNRINMQFIDNPTEYSHAFIQHRLEILEKLIFMDESGYFAHWTLDTCDKSTLLALLNFWGARNPMSFLLIGRHLQLKTVRHYYDKLKTDDRLVREFTTDAMTKEEIIEALHMRGFDLKGYEEFFSFETLSNMMNSWLRFSEQTHSPLLYLMGGPLIHFYNVLPSRTSISPTVQQMQIKSRSKD